MTTSPIDTFVLNSGKFEGVRLVDVPAGELQVQARSRHLNRTDFMQVCEYQRQQSAARRRARTRMQQAIAA